MIEIVHMNLFIGIGLIIFVLVVRIIAFWFVVFGGFVLFCFRWPSTSLRRRCRRRCRLLVVTFDGTVFLKRTFWSAATTFLGRRIFSRTSWTRILFFRWSWRSCSPRTLLWCCLSNCARYQLQPDTNGKMEENMFVYLAIRCAGGATAFLCFNHFCVWHGSGQNSANLSTNKIKQSSQFSNLFAMVNKRHALTAMLCSRSCRIKALHIYTSTYIQAYI